MESERQQLEEILARLPNMRMVYSDINKTKHSAIDNYWLEAFSFVLTTKGYAGVQVRVSSLARVINRCWWQLPTEEAIDRLVQQLRIFRLFQKDWPKTWFRMASTFFDVCS